MKGELASNDAQVWMVNSLVGWPRINDINGFYSFIVFLCFS